MFLYEVAGVWSADLSAEASPPGWHRARMVESMYATPGSSYETVLVVTTSAEAAVLLSNQHMRRSLVDHLSAMAQFML